MKGQTQLSLNVLDIPAHSGICSVQGAHVLIWGTVHHLGRDSAPRLYWTTAHAVHRAKDVYYPEHFKMPDLFWSDLMTMLRLVVVAQSTALFTQEDFFIADQLRPFIEQVRSLIREDRNQQRWSSPIYAEVSYMLACALSICGLQTGEYALLEEAIVIYREVLKEWTRNRAPYEWARTQDNLAQTLYILGESESGTVRLEAAMAAYREALEVWTHDSTPFDWARAQRGLGTVLHCLGERETGTASLKAAIAAYRRALKVLTRDRMPHDWAVTQLDLGLALLFWESAKLELPI